MNYTNNPQWTDRWPSREVSAPDPDRPTEALNAQASGQ